MAKKTTSMRIPPELKQGLASRAHETGVSLASLYERFLGEGLRQDTHPLIMFRQGEGGRRATLAGSRLTVAQVIDTMDASEGGLDDRISETAEYLAIPEGQVRACVRYYADYQAEIDEWRDRIAASAERERESWQRERAVFA